MKSTGIVRKVDELGRVVIPIELRRTLMIGEKDALEIFVEGDTIILKKYEPADVEVCDQKCILDSWIRAPIPMLPCEGLPSCVRICRAQQDGEVHVLLIALTFGLHKPLVGPL